MVAFNGKWVSLLGWLLPLLPAGRSAALEIPLTFRPTSSSSQDWVGEEVHRLARRAQPPPGDWKLPRFRARIPVFSVIYLAGTPHLLVLDKKNPRDSFYNRLFFDADGDGDLTDDPVVEGKAFSRGMGFYYATFPPLEVTIRLPQGTAPYRLEIRAHKRALLPGRGSSRERAVESVSIFMLSACDYTGTLRVGSRSYRLALADSNGNGIFGDRLKKKGTHFLQQEAAQESDRLFLGSGPNFSPQEELRAWGLLALEGLLYKIRFDQPRARLLLDPIPTPEARLSFPVRADRVKLQGLDGAPDILFLGPGREVRVPRGLYKLGCYVLTAKDDGGNLWTLKAQAPQGAPPVRAGLEKPEMILFGPPYTPVVHVRVRFPRRLRRRTVTAHLEFGVHGAGGEEVFFLSSPTNRPSRIARSRKLPDLPKEPAFTILELPGENRVASGNFEYG